MGSNEISQKEILIWLFLVHNFLDFWVPGQPPPPPLRRNPRTRAEGRAPAIWLCCSGLLVSMLLRESAAQQFADLTQFNRDFFFLVLLPPIIFEAGFNMNPRPFLTNIGVSCACHASCGAVPWAAPCPLQCAVAGRAASQTAGHGLRHTAGPHAWPPRVGRVQYGAGCF